MLKVAVRRPVQQSLCILTANFLPLFETVAFGTQEHVWKNINAFYSSFRKLERTHQLVKSWQFLKVFFTNIIN